MMIRFVWLIVALGGLASCQSDQGDAAATKVLSPAASSAIAGDMVSRLVEQVAPGTTTIILKQNSSLDGQSLADALKAWGYAVVTTQQTDNEKALVKLNYAIEEFEGQTLARLSTEKVELTRAYSTSAGGAVPSSPLSVMQRS